MTDQGTGSSPPLGGARGLLSHPLGPWFALWLPLCAWFIYPLWSVPFLPLHDLPNHLARITAYHHLGDPAWGLGDHYARALSPVPYLGHFYTVHLLTYVFGSVMRANLVFMSAYIAAAPLCGLALARATGRSPYLALLLLPLSVGVFFQWGFVAFCVGVMLMLPALAVLYALLDEPTGARALLLGALTLSLYLFHILPWGAYGLYAIVLVALELAARRPKGPLWVLLSTLPSLFVFAWGLIEARSFGYFRNDRAFHAMWDAPRGLLRRCANAMDLWQNRNVDEWLQVGLLLAVLLLLATDAGPSAAESRVPLRRRIRLPLAFLLCLLCAASTPFWIKQPFNWWMVNLRFLMMAAALWVFLPRGPIAGPRSLLLALAFVAMTLEPYYMTRAYKDFARRLDPLIQLIARTPQGSNTLVLHAPGERQFDDRSLAFEMSVWREVYNYPTVLRGGYDPYLYDDGFPVRRTSKLKAPRVERAATLVWSTDQTRFRAPYMAHGWDYFIVRDDYYDAMPPDGVVEEQAREGWVLFRNLLKDQPNDPDPLEPADAALLPPRPAHR